MGSIDSLMIKFICICCIMMIPLIDAFPSRTLLGGSNDTIANVSSHGLSCTDTPPSGSSYTCEQQKQWGKCSSSFMKGYCCKTCFNCQGASCFAPSPPGPPTPPGPSCTDTPPPGSSYSCSQQKQWGKCSSSFMKGYCCKTCFDCNRCGAGPPQPPPPPFPSGSSLPGMLDGLATKGSRCGIEKPNDTRKTMEAKFMDACSGCSGGELATVLAMAMIESDNMDSTDRSKGSSGGRSNWSPFNMNMDELKLLGCDEGCAKGLGQSSGSYDIPGAVGYVLAGLRGGTEIGDTCDFLNFHRDGTSGWKACKGKGCGCGGGECKGCAQYAGAVADAAQQIIKNTQYGTEGYRVCESVQHIRL